jgi:PEGA domain
LALKSALGNTAGQLMTKILTHSGVSAPAQPGGGAVFVAPTQPSAPSSAAEVRTLAPTEQPPATATGPAGLYITSNPQGADVYLGQTKAGTTSPAFQKVNLQAGTNVRVTLKMNLYHDVSFDVTLKPGVMKFEGIELKPAFGSLKIESEPSGAEVYIGGEKVGTTPFSEQRYPSGQYLVTVQKEWYLPQEDQQITVSDGQATAKKYTLSQDFGTLEIESEPAGAEVTLDGKKLGVTPGNWRVPPTEKGNIVISKENFRNKEFSISIGKGQSVKIDPAQATLTGQFGALQVYVDPPKPGVKVFLDGKEIGTAPVTLEKVQVGFHLVKAETAGEAGESNITIAEGKTELLQLTLKGKFERTSCGSVIDRATGLEWYEGSPEKKFTRADSFVRRLRECKGGWRMPTKSELETLYREEVKTRIKIVPELYVEKRYYIWAQREAGSSVDEKFYYGPKGKLLGLHVVSPTTFPPTIFAVRSARYSDASASNSKARITDDTLDALIGIWTGKGYQFDNKSTWSIRIEITEAVLRGNTPAKISYPSLSCSGKLTMESSSKSQLVFAETITSGKRKCVSGGQVQLRPSTDKNVLIFEWYERGKKEADGKLSRK